MMLVALCPTFRRPLLLENAIACFEAQDHPADQRRLLVLDDSGELQPQTGESWQLMVSNVRCSSLPGKYNTMAAMAITRWPETTAFVVWEDDDAFMAWHLSAHAAALATSPGGWSHPSFALTDGSGGTGPRRIRPEATGFARLHGGLAMSREIFARIGGWPDTKRADFDLQILANLRAVMPPANPCRFAAPSYYFRWATTHAYHGQSFGHTPADEEWWDRAAAVIQPQPADKITPAMDAETANLYATAGH